MGTRVVLEGGGSVRVVSSVPDDDTLTQPAVRAADLGAFREAALLVNVLSSDLDAGYLCFESAFEPFDSMFVQIDGSDTVVLTGSGVEGMHIVYLRDFARYVRWSTNGVSGTGTLEAKFEIEAYCKARS